MCVSELFPSVDSVAEGDLLGFPSLPVLGRFLAFGIGYVGDLLLMYVGDLHSPHFCPANCGIMVGMGHSVCRCILSSLLVCSLHEL